MKRCSCDTITARHLTDAGSGRPPGLPPAPCRAVIQYAGAGLYALYGTRHGKPQYADKTPSHLLHVPLLAGRFPRARFVHIVRDGRDVAASLVTMGFGASDFAEAARGWRRKVLKAHAAG